MACICNTSQDRPCPVHDKTGPTFTHEARRWCKGDGEWTSWQNVPPDKLAERRADPTFEVRPLGVKEVPTVRSGAPGANVRPGLTAGGTAGVQEGQKP